MEKILLAQLIAHLLADFFFQPESISKNKQKNGFRSWHLWLHFGIVLVTSLALTFSSDFVPYTVAIAIIHLLIDYLKGLIERREVKQLQGKLKKDEVYDDKHACTTPFMFFADQILHIIVIYIAVLVYGFHAGVVPAYLDYFTVTDLLFVLGFMLCLKPANIVIRVCLTPLNLVTPVKKHSVLSPQSDEKAKTEEDLKRGLEKAGRWIGSFERILALLLVLMHQYAAIGFIITAKSILRFSDKELHKTEYVLVGTLMSFGIAISIGIALYTGYAEAFVRYICCNG